MTNDTIGVDVSKDYLDVHCLGDGRAARFRNDATGFRAFAAWLPKDALARIVYEATGPYHAAFEMRFASRYPLVKVNPLQARRFAQSKGTGRDRCGGRPDSGDDGGSFRSGAFRTHVAEPA